MTDLFPITNAKMPFCWIFAAPQVGKLQELQTGIPAVFFGTSLFNPSGTSVQEIAKYLGWPVGQIEKLHRDQSRTVVKRKMLGKYAFEPERVIPQGINTSLDIQRIMIYGWDMLRSFGFFSAHLLYQQFPFIIYVFEEAVNSDDQTHVFYQDCWFVSNPIDFDLTKPDILMIQNCKIECGSVKVFDRSLGGIASAVKSILQLPSAIEKVVQVVTNLKL